MKTEPSPKISGIYRQITITFVVLAIALEGLLAAYWFYMLKPRLYQEAEIAANLVAQAQAESLANLLSNEAGAPLSELQFAMDAILLSKDIVLGESLVQGMEIELDASLVNEPAASNLFRRGDISCQPCFTSMIPVYNRQTDELAGAATFYISHAFFKALDHDMQIKLLIESGISLIFLWVSWLFIIRLSKKLTLQTENRRQAEQALLEKSQQYQRLLNQLSQYFVYQRIPDGDFIYVSDSIQKITGYHPEQFQKLYKRLLSKASIEQLSGSHESKSQYQDEYRHEIELIDHDGRKHWIELSEIAKQDSQGQTILYEGIGRDVTEMRLTQRNLEQARVLAERASQTKSDFLANMSHEIRTPMNAIIGMSYLVTKTDLSLRQREYLNKIQNASKNLLAIINDILDFSKMEAGKMRIEQTHFNLQEVMENVAVICTPKTDEKGLEFIINNPPTMDKFLLGDPLRVEQVLINLINNAIKFTDQGEVVVSINALQQADHNVSLRFEVKDTGIGISKEDKAQLFQSFNQADTSITRKYGGTGLGLAISQHLVSLMGGDITVESILGLGSVFSFSLSFAISELQAPSKIQKSSHLLTGLSALVVDDNQSSRTMLVELLQDLSINAHSVASGQASIDALCKAEVDGANYDLVLMDWKMPGLNGLETIKSLQQNARLNHIPTLIMVTAYERDELLTQSIDQNISAIVTKPVTASVLVDSIMDAFGYDAQQTIVADSTDNHDLEANSVMAGKRVLIVDDNKINQELTSELLQQYGILNELAGNGVEALSALQTKQFDMVLMDVQMPLMDGYQAAKAIREQPRFKHLPVIAMTAHNMSGDREKSLLAGMNDHLAKPIEIENLYGVLKKWLSGQSIGPAIESMVETNTANQFLPETLPGIELAVGLRKLQNNQKKLRKFWTDFYQDYRHLPDQVKQLVNENNDQELKRQLHTLRGAASNLGALELASAAELFEQAIDQQEGYSSESETFISAVLRVLEGLKQLNNYPQPEHGSELTEGPLNTEECLRLIENLKQNLSKNNFNSIQSFAELKTCIGQHYPEIIEPLESQVEHFLFEPALASLDELHLALNEHE